MKISTTTNRTYAEVVAGSLDNDSAPRDEGNEGNEGDEGNEGNEGNEGDGAAMYPLMHYRGGGVKAGLKAGKNDDWWCPFCAIQNKSIDVECQQCSTVILKEEFGYKTQDAALQHGDDDDCTDEDDDSDDGAVEDHDNDVDELEEEDEALMDKLKVESSSEDEFVMGEDKDEDEDDVDDVAAQEVKNKKKKKKRGKNKKKRKKKKKRGKNKGKKKSSDDKESEDESKDGSMGIPDGSEEEKQPSVIHNPFETETQPPNYDNTLQVAEMIQDTHAVIEKMNIIATSSNSTEYDKLLAKMQIVEAVKMIKEVTNDLICNNTDDEKVRDAIRCMIESYQVDILPIAEETINDIHNKLRELSPEEVIVTLKGHEVANKAAQTLMYIINHWGSKDMITWSEDGTSVMIRISSISDCCEWFTKFGMKIKKTTAQSARTVLIYKLTEIIGFKREEDTSTHMIFTHASFRRDNPALVNLMKVATVGRDKISCQLCQEVKYLTAGKTHCASCSGDDPKNIPLDTCISSENKEKLLKEMVNKMLYKNSLSNTNDGKKTSSSGSDGRPYKFLTPSEVLEHPEYIKFLKLFQPRRNIPTIMEMEELGPALCDRPIDEITHHTVTSRAACAHFASAAMKLMCKCCAFCGKEAEGCRATYEMHFHHVRQHKDEYMAPAHAFSISSTAIRKTLPLCIMLCAGCHSQNEHCSWFIDEDYKCVIMYELQDKAPSIKEIFMDKRFKTIETLLTSKELTYGGIYPKISAASLDLILFDITGFALSDVVTWAYSPDILHTLPKTEHDDEEDDNTIQPTKPCVWDIRNKIGMGSYLATDLLYNLTKKMQGKCIECGMDIANVPPFKLNYFHGMHSESGAKVKELNPSDIRCLGWENYKHELEEKLKGFGCAKCHGLTSTDIGKPKSRDR